MKKYLLGACAVVLAIAFTAFTTDSKRFATVSFEFVGSAFAMGDASGVLDDDISWSPATPSCATGENKIFLCKTVATYSVTTPTEQEVREAIKAEYDRLAGLSQTFTDLYSFNKELNGETVSIQIFLKHVNQ